MRSVFLYFVFPVTFSAILHVSGGGLSNFFNFKSKQEFSKLAFFPIGFGFFSSVTASLNYFFSFKRLFSFLLVLLVLLSISYFRTSRRFDLLDQTKTFVLSVGSSIPVIFASFWNYWRWSPKGVNAATASADLISFASTSDFLLRNSQASMQKISGLSVGKTWLLNHLEFHFSFGDASFSNLSRQLLGVDATTGVQMAIALSIIAICIGSFNLFCALGLTQVQSFLGVIAVTTLPITVENSLAHSLASQLGLASFVCWLTIFALVAKNELKVAPILTISIASSGIIAVYPQYLVIVAAIAIVLFMRRKYRLLQMLTVLALSSLFVLPSSVQALKFMTSTSTAEAANTFDNPFFTDGAISTFVRLMGLSPVLTTGTESQLFLLIPILILVVLIVSIFKAEKLFLLNIVVFLSAICLIFVVLLLDASYSEYRLLRMLIPAFWIWIVFVISTSKLKNWASCLLVVPILFSTANYISSSKYMSHESVSDRTIDDNYKEIKNWISELKLKRDDQILFLSDDFFTSHFGLFELREFSSIRHPVLVRTYFRETDFNKWNGVLPRYVLLDRYSHTNIEIGSILRKNDRFVLVDRLHHSISGLMRTPGSDRSAGYHYLTTSKLSVMTLDTSFWIFAFSTTGSVDVNFSCADGNSGYLTVLNLDQFHELKDRYEIYLGRSASVRITVPKDVGWSLLRVEPASTPLNNCLLNLYAKSKEHK